MGRSSRYRDHIPRVHNAQSVDLLRTSVCMVEMLSLGILVVGDVSQNTTDSLRGSALLHQI